MEFMTHVPGIAMRHCDQRLGEFFRSSERIELGLVEFERLAGFCKSRKSLYVVPEAEAITMTEEHRRTKRRIVIEIVVGRGETVKGIRVDFVQHLRSVDADEHNLFSPFNGHLDVGRLGYIDHTSPVIAILTCRWGGLVFHGWLST